MDVLLCPEITLDRSEDSSIDFIRSVSITSMWMVVCEGWEGVGEAKVQFKVGGGWG